MDALDNVPRGPYSVRLAPRGAGEEPDVYVDFRGDDGLDWSLARIYATAGDAVAVGKLMAASREMYEALSYAVDHDGNAASVVKARRAMAVAKVRS